MRNDRVAARFGEPSPAYLPKPLCRHRPAYSRNQTSTTGPIFLMRMVIASA